MKYVPVFIWLMTGVIALIFGALIVDYVVASNEGHRVFKMVCSEVNGKVVWDGRQNQCIKGNFNE